VSIRSQLCVRKLDELSLLLGEWRIVEGGATIVEFVPVVEGGEGDSHYHRCATMGKDWCSESGCVTSVTTVL